MGLVYKLGYFIPFLIFYFSFYLKRFNPNLGSFLWLTHFIYTIIFGKLAFMFLHSRVDFSIILKPCCMVSVGVIFGAYTYLTILAWFLRVNPIPWWNELTLLAPLGIILIRLGNIFNGEAEGLINYATLDIIGAFILSLFFIFSEKIRKNAVIFALFFYTFWRILFTEYYRFNHYELRVFLLAFPLFLGALATYVFTLRLYKKGLLRNKKLITMKDFKFVLLDYFKKLKVLFKFWV